MSIGKRERSSTEFFEDTATNAAANGAGAGDLKARFDLSAGRGTQLAQFPGWVPTSVRGANKKAEGLEDALEPLHRAIFGRPGKAGERRHALAEYRGFPEAQRPIFKAKVTTWKKEQLKDLVQALQGTGILVSVPVATLAEDVLKFLEFPHVAKAAAATATATPKPKAPVPTKTERAATTESDGAPPASTKKARTETPVVAAAAATKKIITPPPAAATTKTATGKSATVDTVRVEVYRRVLAMPEADRNTLSIKDLRQTIGTFLKLDDATMKGFGDALKETAVECVKALRAEAARAVEAAASANEATHDGSGNTVAAVDDGADAAANDDHSGATTTDATATAADASPKVALLDEEQ